MLWSDIIGNHIIIKKSLMFTNKGRSANIGVAKFRSFFESR